MLTAGAPAGAVLDYWQAALLGLVQGLSEFFPVSSDGHLVAVERWLGVRVEGSGAGLECFLHLGTLAALLICFRRDVVRMLGLLRTPRRLLAPAVDDELGQDARFVLLGSAATAVGALPFLRMFEGFYDSKLVLVGSLAVTGLLLVAARWLARLPARPADVTQALLVGFIQVLAILPGLSRSCSTVVMGLAVGIPVARVARLSFLLSIPAVFGATLVEVARFAPTATELPRYATGALVALASGLFAVRAMMNLVPRGRMHWFAPYVLLFALFVGLTA